MPALKERLAKFTEKVTDLKDGATLVIQYVPGKGTTIEGGKDAYVAEGKDFAELATMPGFPVLAVGFDPRGTVQTGVDWNVPVRIGGTTVLPGDVVLADSYAALFFPPQLAAKVIQRAREIAGEEEYARELVRRRDRPFREIYPMGPELRQRYQQERGK